MTDIEIAKRLEKLERDNRRLKRLGIAVLVLAALLAIHATWPARPASQGTKVKPDFLAGATRIHDKLVASEIDVVDSSGKVRLKMDASKGQPIIEMRDRQGTSVLNLGVNSADGPGLTLRLPPWDFDWEDVKPQKGQVVRECSLHVGISPDTGPRITLSDPAGYSMDLGGTKTRTIATGAIQYTSADSIIMFGNGKNHIVIWKAPAP